MPTPPAPAGRRGFLGRLSAFLGAATLGGAASPRFAAAQQRADGPLVHPQDAWIDALPSGHRMVFDAYTTGGAVRAGRFASNWVMSNVTGYGLTQAQLGLIIVLRSQATVYAYDDAMWAKYPQIARLSGLTDPTTKQPFTVNPFLQPGAESGPTQGVQWQRLVEKGAHFIACNGTTTALAGTIAGDGADAAAVEAVRQELAAHLMPNAHLMATGILGLGRAQEKGFTFGCGG
jgi:hypothetical protein